MDGCMSHGWFRDDGSSLVSGSHIYQTRDETNNKQVELVSNHLK